MTEVDTVSYGRGPAFLSRWYDAGLEIPEGITVEQLAQEERERISIAIATVLYASTIPRRLGGDSADNELASDKKRCRRVGHALRQAYRGWDKKQPSVSTSDEIRQAGAQLVWEEFKQGHLSVLVMRETRAATFAVRTMNERWGRSALTNLENERNWLTYALRD